MREKKRVNSKQPPWEPASETEAASFGRWLRQQREVREISLREISETSKISLRYLEAFEEDRFDLLPAQVFANGFLRQYARYVGLDPDDVVNRFLVARRGGEGTEDEAPSAGKPRQEVVRRNPPRTWPLLALIGLVALALLALVFFVPVYLDSRAAARTPVPTVAPPPPPVPSPDLPEPSSEVEAPGPAATSPSGAPIHVTLEFLAECWYEAIVDGKSRTEEIRIQGETVELEAQTRLDLKFGNAGGVSMSVNGKPYPLGASPGEVKAVRLDLAALGITEAPSETGPPPAASRPETAPVP